MIPHLVDTNMLLRFQRPGDPSNRVAQDAVNLLSDRGGELYITSQNVVEYWNVATRPLERNGLGLSIEDAENEIKVIESLFLFAPEKTEIYDTWRRLIIQYRVSGVQVHDARLVAVMRVHGIRHILTFNTADFARYADLITAVHPQSLVASP